HPRALFGSDGERREEGVAPGTQRRRHLGRREREHRGAAQAGELPGGPGEARRREIVFGLGVRVRAAAGGTGETSRRASVKKVTRRVPPASGTAGYFLFSRGVLRLNPPAARRDWHETSFGSLGRKASYPG